MATNQKQSELDVGCSAFNVRRSCRTFHRRGLRIQFIHHYNRPCGILHGPVCFVASVWKEHFPLTALVDRHSQITFSPVPSGRGRIGIWLAFLELIYLEFNWE